MVTKPSSRTRGYIPAFTVEEPAFVYRSGPMNFEPAHVWGLFILLDDTLCGLTNEFSAPLTPLPIPRVLLQTFITMACIHC